MPPEIQTLADRFLQNPEEIKVSPPSTTANTVVQQLVATPSKDYEKRETLRNLIRGQDELKNAIIFCNRKRDVSDLYRSLERHEFSVGALHGDMDQRARMAMLQSFRDGKIQLLVASDVAARGLDIPDVSHIFNFDVPIHPEDYVHRIGRTGRAGRTGAAFTLVTKRETKSLQAIEKLIDKKIDWLDGGLKTLADSKDEGGQAEEPLASRCLFRAHRQEGTRHRILQGQGVRQEKRRQDGDERQQEQARASAAGTMTICRRRSASATKFPHS